MQLIKTDWRTETRICKRNGCGTDFLPVAAHQIYCTKTCYHIAQRPIRLASAKRYQAKKKKFAYKGDNEFRLIVESLKVLKCTQEICAPNCRIRGMEQFGCTA